MHGESFHYDAFVIFLLIGFLIAMVLRVITHRLIRWTRHVNYMRKLAGGTLIVDAEAEAWFKLISDPAYVSQWRWTYGEQWKDKYGKTYVPGKRSPTRKIGYISIVLVIAILGVLTMPYLSGFFGGLGAQRVIQTKQTVLATGNLTLAYFSEFSGYGFDLNGTTEPRGPSNPYLGGYAILHVRLERTDRGYGDANVFVNITSGTFSQNGTLFPFLSYAHWFFDNRTGDNVDEFNNTGQDGQFGMLVNVPGRGFTEYLVVLRFRPFDPYFYEQYIAVQSYGNGGISDIRIYGGYYTSPIR